MKNVLFIVLACNTLMAVAQSTWQLNNRVELTNSGFVLSNMTVVLPIPQSNIYQTLHSLEHNSGTIATASNNNNRYLIENTSGTPASGETYSASYDVNITLYPMYIDMRQFTTLYPYDTNSESYRKYTSSVGEYIDLDNDYIREAADFFWIETKGNLIDYAFACYLHAGTGFGYKNSNTGLHHIQQILLEGGGDCGNLSSIFINLLRVKGIPARHIVMVRPNGSYHVVADFYLERYGWIPVDVTMKHDYPSGNYFGYFPGDGVVMSTDIGSIISPGGNIGNYNAVLLQTYFYWYRYSSGNGNLFGAHRVTSRLDSERKSPVLKSAGSRSAVIQCTPYEGITHYTAKVYRLLSDSLEYEARIDKAGDLILDGLSPQTSYVASISSCRTVDNIETTTGTWEIGFKTASSPVDNEKASSDIRVIIREKSIVITANEKGEGNIYSIGGRLIMSMKINKGDNNFTLPGRGVYILKLTFQSRKERVQKIIVN